MKRVRADFADNNRHAVATNGRADVAEVSANTPGVAMPSWNDALRRAIGVDGLRIEPDACVRIAVIDDGVAAHPALARSLGTASNGPATYAHSREVLARSDIEWNIAPSRCVGEHATWVAGAIGGEHDGRALGVFPGARIDSWSPAGVACAQCTSALQLTSTIRAAADDGARIVNLSMRLRGQPVGRDLWRDTIDYVARKENVLIVLAAGNAVADLDASWLADWRRDFPPLLIVTSMRHGRIDGGYGARTVSLAVPFDEAMCTTSMRAIATEGCPELPVGSGFGYTRRCETSIAAAVVSAAAAMVLSSPRYRDASAADVAHALLANARRDGTDPRAPLTDPGGRLWLGFLAD